MCWTCWLGPAVGGVAPPPPDVYACPTVRHSTAVAADGQTAVPLLQEACCPSGPHRFAARERSPSRAFCGTQLVRGQFFEGRDREQQQESPLCLYPSVQLVGVRVGRRCVSGEKRTDTAHWARSDLHAAVPGLQLNVAACKQRTPIRGLCWCRGSLTYTVRSIGPGSVRKPSEREHAP